MIIDQLPSITIANDSDEIAIEQGTATKKITKQNFLKEVNADIGDVSDLSGFTATDLTGAANELKTSLNNLGSDDVANDSSNVSGATVTAAIDSLKSSLATVPDFAPKTAIPQNSNLNDYRTAGTYYVQTDVIAATISNIPRNASGILIVINRGSNNVYCSQFYMPTTSMTLIYVRNYNSGSWTGWATISNSINEELTLTRTENDLQNDTDFARIKAYRRNGVLTLYLNSLFNANKTTSEFVEIGRISGWSAIGEVLQSTPAQSTTYSAITYHVSSDGIIKVLVAGTSLKAFYRAVITVPCS